MSDSEDSNFSGNESDKAGSDYGDRNDGSDHNEDSDKESDRNADSDGEQSRNVDDEAEESDGNEEKDGDEEEPEGEDLLDEDVSTNSNYLQRLIFFFLLLHTLPVESCSFGGRVL